MTNFEHPYLERKPRLSIVISAVQSVSTLDETIDSILTRDFSDIEVIVVCNHPEDRVREKVDLLQKSDSRIDVFCSDDLKLSEIRTIGLEKANGTYISFLNADNQLVPGTFINVIKLMDESGGELIGFSNGLTGNGNGRTIKGCSMPNVTEPIEGEDLLTKMIMSESFFPDASMYVYRRSFLQNINRSVSDGYLNDNEFYTIRNLCMADRALSTSEEVYYIRNKDVQSADGQSRVEKLKGWSGTISQLLSFMNKYPLKEMTQQVILKRARELAHNLVEVIHQLNSEKSLALSLDHYFTKNELSQLGYGIRIRNKYPGLYHLISD